MGSLTGSTRTTPSNRWGRVVESVKYQISDEGRVYDSANRRSPNPEIRDVWVTMRPTYNFSADSPHLSATYSECCNYDYKCSVPVDLRGIGCVPAARAFHTVSPGYFVAGKLSMIIYGGLDHTGVALGDLWMLDGDDQTPGCSFWHFLARSLKYHCANMDTATMCRS